MYDAIYPSMQLIQIGLIQKTKKGFIIFGQYKTKMFAVRTQGLLRIHMQ